jgi:hypothetical protein
MDRFTLAVVGGVLALIAAAIAAALLVRGSAAPPDLSTPSGTVLAYAQAERRGDAHTAWGLLAPAEQSRLDRDRFLARAADASDKNVYLTTEDERLDADGASVVLVRTYLDADGGLFGGGHSSYRTRRTVRLVRVDQDWRISVPPDVYSLTLSQDPRP